MDRQRILVADDNQINRIIICEMLEERYEIIEACNGAEAVSLIQTNHEDIDLVLLDVVMPEMDGIEVLEVMREQGWIDDIPVIMISAETSSEYIRRAIELGAEDYIGRPFDPEIVSHRIRNALMLHAEQRQLMDAVAEQVNTRQRQSNMMITILSHVVEYRNGESGLHVLHINAITGILLHALIKRTDRYHIPEEDISIIRSASSLHDIGKIGIDYDILNKPGRLTPEEFEVMKTHSAIGYDMLQEMPVYRDEKLIQYAGDICRWHHERWDGGGYPDGLAGDEIPIAAQVVSLADAYDALTSVRCYKDAYSHEQTIQMIMDGQCGAFNPLLLECLRDVDEQLRSIAEHDTDPATYDIDSDVFSRQLLHDLQLNDGVDVSRNIRLLREQRQRQEYIGAFTSEAWFEYFSEPPMILFNEASQKLIGVPWQIKDPLNAPELYEVFGADVIQAIQDKIDERVSENDRFAVVLKLTNGHSYRFQVGVMRSDRKDGERVNGIMGRIELYDECAEQVRKELANEC